MWATTKNSTSVHFGLGHRCHKHGRMFDLEHLATCSEIQGCPDIARYAQRLKQGENIRLWPREELADAVLQYTQLALQLANLTATSRASLAQQAVKPKERTGNKRGRPRASEVVARTNHKVDDFFLRKAQPAQRLGSSPSGAAQEEETKTPQQRASSPYEGLTLQSQQFNTPEQEGKGARLLTPASADPIKKGEGMAVALRQLAKREKLSKKRYGGGASAPLDLGMNEEYYQEVPEA